MEPMQLSKTELLERISTTRAALEQVLLPLSPEQLSRPGPQGEWSIKNHLAHLTTWETMLTVMLEGGPYYEVFGLTRQEYDEIDLNSLNAKIDGRNKARPLSEVLEAFAASHQHLLTVLNKLGEAELGQSISYFQPQDTDERPILIKISGDTYAHYEEHRLWIEQLIQS